MLRLDLDGKLRGVVAIDLCFVCQGIWFDAHESPAIAPGGVIELFRLIHEHRDHPRLPLSARLHCPRCDEELLHSLDIGKSGKFNYHRCPQDHGRFTAFAQLMIEKGFVRQLSPVEIQAFAARVSSIHCTACGAPFDIRTDAACPHCHAPIAILDPDAVEQAMVSYRDAEARRTQRDPAVLADAVLAAERERLHRYDPPRREDAIGDLVVSGMDAVWKLLNH